MQLAIDFHNFKDNIKGYSSLMLVTNCYSGFIWDFYLKDQISGMIIKALKMLFGILKI